MSHGHLVSPLALDLGASKTGVFSAIYSANSDLAAFSKNTSRTAFVADIDKNGYTLLQAGRTANRHAIRGRTRNKQAKKLLTLILEYVYSFPAEKHREAISHLMNRRGFTYLENQVDTNKLDSLSSELLGGLVQELKEKGQADIAGLFEVNTPSDALNELVCHHTSDLGLIQTNLTKWAATDKKLKSQTKPLQDALAFYIKDLTAGAKFRAKYFNAVRKDIALMRRHPLKVCRKLFFALGDYGKRHKIDMPSIFYQLLCHVNNFDLKLLNRIHKEVDGKKDVNEIEEIVSRHFGKWVCKHWSLSKANGEARLAEIKELQQAWKKFEAHTPGKVFDFLIGTSPEQTIPPYESHTNRHPPRCQTLKLNPDELEQSYPEWKNWLVQLTAIDEVATRQSDYQQRLSEVTSSKGNPLINQQELAARQLQLVLDTSKSSDPFQLNEIWSKLKKRKELQRKNQDTASVENQLKEVLQATRLPTWLHPDIQNEASPGDFWHLVNRYYQIRRRARAGRYFLYYDRQQPESQRWQHNGKLLMMCQHRPRQLSHQALMDVAVLLGAGHQQLPAADIDQLQDLFRNVRGLKTACEQAYRAQKRHGADLKMLLHTDPELIKLNAKVPGLITQLAEAMKLSTENTQTFCERNRSFYVLAQLYPLIWGDRSGFGKTCPVCAQDNAARMSDANNQPQASRLTTLSMRLIDGALKRLLTHQAHHIANRVWPSIQEQAKGARKVTLPLILEQNRFDFTENLPALKGLPTPKKTGKTIDLKGKKNERIQQASKGVCPYTGEVLTEHSGDIDHIIPRSSGHGVLNDEANLIYASVDGNRKIKQDRLFTLSNLSPAYLKQQFGTADPQAITQQIEKSLWSDDKTAFRFGNYRQFIALDEPTQTAFRHALFLNQDHPLRARVIDALGHRHKAKVNGTQRYMAQLLADVLTAKAKGTELEGKLDFDYFEVSSNGLDEDSTVALRKLIRTSNVKPELDLKAFDKEAGTSQHDYSHVIDATLAFMIALDKHQDEGALRMVLPEGQTVWGEVDDDGLVTAKVFEQIAVEPERLAPPVKVVPRSSLENVQALQKGASPHQAISRPVFKKNAVGLNFYDLCLLEGQLFKGFMQPSKTRATFRKAHEKPADKKQEMIQFAHKAGYYRLQQHGEQSVYHPNKQKLTELLFTTLNAAKDQGNFSAETEKAKLALWLFSRPGGAGQLFFYTNNASLQEAPAIIEKQSHSPYYDQWKQHYDQWLEIAPDTKVDKGTWVISADRMAQWHQHCRAFLSIEANERSHRAVKDYAMKAITTGSGAMALVRRFSGSGKPVYQLHSFDNATLGSDETPVFALNSPNVALLKKERITKGYPQELKEKKAFEPQVIPSNLFFKAEPSAELELDLDRLEVFATKATQVEVRKLPASWFAEHLLQAGDAEDARPWHKQKILAISRKIEPEASIKQDVLQSLLVRGCKVDKNAGIALDGEQLVLRLPYKSDSLTKLLKE